MAYIVMACVVMVYIVMAYIVMACVVMVYIVMALYSYGTCLIEYAQTLRNGS